jgi:DNA-directed RNA polymerase subunit K/omega
MTITEEKLEICNIIVQAISEIEEGCTTNDIKKKVSGLRN